MSTNRLNGISANGHATKRQPKPKQQVPNLPALLVGWFDADGKLCRVTEIPDPRVHYIRAAEGLEAEGIGLGGYTFRPLTAELSAGIFDADGELMKVETFDNPAIEFVRYFNESQQRIEAKSNGRIPAKVAKVLDADKLAHAGKAVRS